MDTINSCIIGLTWSLERTVPEEFSYLSGKYDEFSFIIGRVVKLTYPGFSSFSFENSNSWPQCYYVQGATVSWNSWSNPPLLLLSNEVWFVGIRPQVREL